MYIWPNIPLCRSEALQDFTIKLGLYLKSKTNGWSGFSAEVDVCEFERENLERLTLWIWTHYSTRVNFTLWEDRTVWVGVELLPEENGEPFRVGFYPSFEKLTAEEKIEALVDTVSVSTRLCYDENPLPILRQIWKHDGDVEIKGIL